MTADDLEAEFRSRAASDAGGLLLLTADDAVAMVRRAKEESLRILGIDGIFVRPHETVSPIEHIADFSAATRRGDGCWAQAEGFIRGRDSLGLVFEVTVGKHLAPAV